MFKGSHLAALVLAGAVMVSTPACASGVLYPQRYPIGDRDDRVYYNRGFHEGQEAGVDDARRGRSYDLRRHREFRDNRRGEDRGDLRAFRDGFASGYEDGYRRASRDRYDDRRRDVPPVPVYPRLPERDGGIFGGGRYISPAAENGYRDGFEAGQRASRNGDRFDPIREKRYRDGDHDYNGRYGSRDQYKREYRDAFQQGYEAGFRGYRR